MFSARRCDFGRDCEVTSSKSGMLQPSQALSIVLSINLFEPVTRWLEQRQRRLYSRNSPLISTIDKGHARSTVGSIGGSPMGERCVMLRSFHFHSPIPYGWLAPDNFARIFSLVTGSQHLVVNCQPPLNNYHTPKPDLSCILQHSSSLEMQLSGK
jgi:hypothetical protein